MRYLLLLFSILTPLTLAAEFPERPLKIIVYTNPGGLIDTTARKAAQILQQRYLSQPVVVENKKGAGGLVALSAVLSRPADGHTIFGLTNSVISKAVGAGQEARLHKLDYLIRLANDYECLIVHEESPIQSVADIAEQVKGGQEVLWAGPASGGTDHLFAKKFWQVAGISGKWIPYRSGSEAVAAVLGRHADIYVGNPQDIRGRQGLRILAVASRERLPRFGDIPTFEELGMSALTDESLWRGFAVKAGTPPARIKVLEELFLSLAGDTEWQAFLAQGDVEGVHDTGDSFDALVAKQIQSDRRYLSQS